VEILDKTGKGKDWTVNKKKIRETGSIHRRHESGRPKYACTEENMIAVVGDRSTKPGRPETNTSLNTPNIQRNVRV